MIHRLSNNGKSIREKYYHQPRKSNCALDECEFVAVCVCVYVCLHTLIQMIKHEIESYSEGCEPAMCARVKHCNTKHAAIQNALLVYTRIYHHRLLEYILAHSTRCTYGDGLVNTQQTHGARLSYMTVNIYVVNLVQIKKLCFHIFQNKEII